MIYEPLLQFDVLKPNVIYPWLAKSWKWSDGDKALTFELRHGVRWTDGKPFTSADAVFSFKLIKDNAALNSQGITFASVSAVGPTR